MKSIESLIKELQAYKPNDLVKAYEGESNGLIVFDEETREDIGFIYLVNEVVTE